MQKNRNSAKEGSAIHKNTIFSKYFTTCSLIIIVSFIVLGAVLLSVMWNYNISETETRLRRDAEKTSELFSISIENNYPNVQAALFSGIKIFAKSNETHLIVTNAQGKIIFTSGTEDTSFYPTIKSEYMDRVLGGMNYTGIGNLGGVYSEKVTTVGVPIKIGEENVVGAVFASAEMPYMSGLFAEFFRFFAFSSLLVLLLSFVTIYFMTARLVRPIKKMSNVAKQFAKGDFDERIAIDEDSEEEIAELATAFNNMAYSLKHLEEIRSSFVANVSHDLRTPMTTISGFVDGILDGTIPKEKEEYYLKIVSDETKRLARLTRTLLALSKIQDGQMKMIKAPFDICDLTGRIVVGFEQRISEKNIFIDIKFSKDTIRVLADYDSMYQVMYNLIDNAVKFCNQGGKITVEIREEKDKKVFISVKNTGAGIAEKDIPMVFDRFYKGDKSRSEDKGGSGLGLYIVKTIITAHDQEIKVRSAQNEYCEFYFTLARAE